MAAAEVAVLDAEFADEAGGANIELDNEDKEVVLGIEVVAVLAVETAFGPGTVASTVADGILNRAAEVEQQLRFPGSLGVRSQQ
jgi:hypothetical protein